MAKTWNYQTGDRLDYVPFGGGVRTIIVLTREADVKGGQPGFTGRMLGSDDDTVTVWGYDDQIIATRTDRWKV